MATDSGLIMFRPPFSPGGGLEDVTGDVLSDGRGVGVAEDISEWRRLAGAGGFADPSDLLFRP